MIRLCLKIHFNVLTYHLMNNVLNEMTWLLLNVVVYLIKKFKFIVIFGTLQVGIRAQLEWIRHISVCSDLKFAALNVFKTIFTNKRTKREKFVNRKTETQCVRSAGAKISEVFHFFCVYCLLGIGCIFTS